MFNWTAFLSFALLACFTPGPNNIMAMAIAGQSGLRRALRFGMGVIAAFAVLFAGSIALNAMLSRFVPQITAVMKYLGAAYILWLSWRVLTSKPVTVTAAKTIAPPKFITGLLLQFVNIKILLYGLVTLSSFVLPYRSDVPFVLMFVLIMTCSLSTGLLTWSVMGSLFQAFLNRHYKLVNIIMAVVLVQSMVGLLLN